MNEEEKKALELLKDKAREAAMGVAEETEVYQNAENIIRKHPVLAATVKSIVDKEIGA